MMYSVVLLNVPFAQDRAASKTSGMGEKPLSQIALAPSLCTLYTGPFGHRLESDKTLVGKNMFTALFKTSLFLNCIYLPPKAFAGSGC